MPPSLRASPGRESSSPVATIATRGLRVTEICGKSAAASSATSRAERRCPRPSKVSPARKSSARRPHIFLRPWGFLDDDASAFKSVSSWMTTASAPSGTTPPVKMRTAWPGADRPGKRASRGRFADDGKLRSGMRIAYAHRIAVHRRHGRRRLIQFGDRVLSQDATRGIGDGHGFGRKGAKARVIRATASSTEIIAQPCGRTSHRCWRGRLWQAARRMRPTARGNVPRDSHTARSPGPRPIWPIG